MTCLSLNFLPSKIATPQLLLERLEVLRHPHSIKSLPFITIFSTAGATGEDFLCVPIKPHASTFVVSEATSRRRSWGRNIGLYERVRNMNGFIVRKKNTNIFNNDAK